jgi:hypothetical protein
MVCLTIISWLVTKQNIMKNSIVEQSYSLLGIQEAVREEGPGNSITFKQCLQ